MLKLGKKMSSLNNNRLNVTFVGGSVARRLGEAAERLGPFNVINKAVSGGGLLMPSEDGMRHCKLIDLNQFKNEKNLVIQVGGNDFFAHSKEGKHITTLKIFKDKYSQSHFNDAIQEFLRNFTGGSVWFVGLFPRYLHECCDKHLDERSKKKGHDLVSFVNIAIQKQVHFYNKKIGKSIFFLNPQLLHGMENKAALSMDNIHLTDDANNLCAKKIISCIETENKKQAFSESNILEL